MAGFSGTVEGGVLHQSDVVNNLTSTDTTKVLAAPQGKALSELISSLSNAFSIGRLPTTAIIAGKNLVEMGICANTAMYIIILGSQALNAQDVWCMYCIRNTGSSFVLQSTIYEGTDSYAPRINADGTIARADGATISGSYAVRYTLITIPT